MTERVFVFTEELTEKQRSDYVRPRLYAIPESKIVSVESQRGSQNCYLVVNGIRVQGSFEDFVTTLGERIDIK